MGISLCTKCNIMPEIQSDELGITYRFICAGCGKCTETIISPSSSLSEPHADEQTINRLTEMWNNIN